MGRNKSEEQGYKLFYTPLITSTVKTAIVSTQRKVHTHPACHGDMQRKVLMQSAEHGDTGLYSLELAG